MNEKNSVKQEEGMQRGKCLSFGGNSGRLLLEESISLFHGKTNPIRCFSVDELNAMVLDCDCYVFVDGFSKWYKECIIREIVVSTQMGSHNNVQKLLGCCLETDLPVLVYEWVGTETLADRILGVKSQNRPPLEWKARLKNIAYKAG
ncbi:hypothetical protein SOVF_078140 [Spinacia oleracea]|nr:hypothetical protein SOVF_078140 [Spinacia oleracea]